MIKFNAAFGSYDVHKLNIEQFQFFKNKCYKRLIKYPKEIEVDEDGTYWVSIPFGIKKKITFWCRDNYIFYVEIYDNNYRFDFDEKLCDDAKKFIDDFKSITTKKYENFKKRAFFK